MLVFVPVTPVELESWAQTGRLRPGSAYAVTSSLSAAFGFAPADAEDAEGARTYEEAHAEFCREHLFRWAPEFFQRVEQGADTDFYRGIGILGQDACAQVAAALVDAAAG